MKWVNEWIVNDRAKVVGKNQGFLLATLNIFPLLALNLVGKPIPMWIEINILLIIAGFVLLITKPRVSVKK